MADFYDLIPESWRCVDCGVNTAPRSPTRAELRKAVERMPGVESPEEKAMQVIERRGFDKRTEMFTVWDDVWKAAGMEPSGGCLCIRCIEKRLGRELRPDDFDPDDGLNHPAMPGTRRRAARLAGKKLIK